MDDNYINLIVECDIGEHSEAIINEFCRVKYCLPDLGYYVVEVPEKDFSRVAGISGVKAVHSSAVITAQSKTLTGKGVTIAFLDTGISPVRNFTEPENRILAFKDFINGLNVPYDDNAHGTHVPYLSSHHFFNVTGGFVK